MGLFELDYTVVSLIMTAVNPVHKHSQCFLVKVFEKWNPKFQKHYEKLDFSWVSFGIMLCGDFGDVHYSDGLISEKLSDLGVCAALPISFWVRLGQFLLKFLQVKLTIILVLGKFRIDTKVASISFVHEVYLILVPRFSLLHELVAHVHGQLDELTLVSDLLLVAIVDLVLGLSGCF